MIESLSIELDRLPACFMEECSNTVEFMTIFVSLMLISGYYFDGPITAVVGLFWIISRQWYRIGYMRNVKDRIPGFLMGDMVLALLVVGGLWGIGQEILARFVV